MGKIGEDRMGDWVTFIEQQSSIIKEKDGVIGKVGEKRGRFYKIRIEERGKIGERRVKGNVTSVLQQFVLQYFRPGLKILERVEWENRLDWRGEWENRLDWRKDDGRTG